MGKEVWTAVNEVGNFGDMGLNHETEISTEVGISLEDEEKMKEIERKNREALIEANKSL